MHLPSSHTLYLNISDMVHRVFPNLGENYRKKEWIGQRAILTAQNVQLQYINFKVREVILATTKEYLSADTLKKSDENEL